METKLDLIFMTAPPSLTLLKLRSRLALLPLTCALLVSCGGKQSFTSDDVSSDDADTATTDELNHTDGSDSSHPEQTTAGTETSTDDSRSGVTTSVGGSDVTASETNGTNSFDAGAGDDDAGQETVEHSTNDTGSDNTADDTGGTSADTTCGRPAEDYVALGKDCHLIDLNCSDGAFTDDCGCGCLTPIADPTEGACPAPVGTRIDVPADAVHKLNCNYSFDGILGVVVRTELAYDELVEQVLPRCGGGFDAPHVDFDSSMIFVATVAERPDADFLHAVVTDQGIAVGFEGPAYCGGAAPPSSLFLLELPRSDHDVTYDVCYTGDCGSGPFPP